MNAPGVEYPVRRTLLPAPVKAESSIGLSTAVADLYARVLSSVPGAMVRVTGERDDSEGEGGGRAEGEAEAVEESLTGPAAEAAAAMRAAVLRVASADGGGEAARSKHRHDMQHSGLLAAAAARQLLQAGEDPDARGGAREGRETVAARGRGVTVVELGAGKGHLGLAAARAVPGAAVVAVDRALGLRHKADAVMRREQRVLERVNADLRHLDLRRVALLRDRAPGRVVALSKHLCGPATDYALRSLVAAGRGTDGAGALGISGGVIALCCHHRCTADTFVGGEWLASLGCAADDVATLAKASSWAVLCAGDGGTGGEDAVVVPGAGRKRARAGPGSGAGSEPGSLAAQISLGRRCKRILDVGRVDFLRRNGFQACLQEYTSTDVTKENVALVFWRA